MTTTTSRELPGDSRTGRSDVPRVTAGRGWQAGEKREGTAWRPAVDMSERGDAYRVTVEIPGIKADEVEITMADGLLTIQGERHAVREAAGEKIHRSERTVRAGKASSGPASPSCGRAGSSAVPRLPGG